MARVTDPLPTDYLARTRELPVNLVFLFPWVLVYQLSLLATKSPLDNAAAAWVKHVGGSLGRDGLRAATLLACLLLCVFVVRRVRQAPHDRGIYGGMLLEGLVYGALLGLVSQALAGSLPLGRMVPLGPADALLGGLRGGLQDLGLAVGAGLFEEVVFRGLLVTALLFLLRHGIGTDRVTAALVAVAAAAWVFSAWHHWGDGAEPFHPVVFAFRFWAGVVLGIVFVGRGLGIAAFAHGFYDVLVATSSWSS
jgi:membrane protease YdiL (CAAX protease family)